ncbi:MAG: YeaH/YhbH family protein [Enterovibrio sp.]
MANFIDRRLNGKNKSAVNRQRFLSRHKQQIKNLLSDAINRRSITDLKNGEKITIAEKDISEPIFHHDVGGQREMVHPGNDRFVAGDKIDRPSGPQNKKMGEGQAGNSGDGEDDFVFHISKDEYLDLLFEDLELPDLKETSSAKLVDEKTRRSGFKSSGVPANIAIIRSLQNSLARRIAISAGKKKQIRELKEDLANLQKNEPAQPLEEKRVVQQIEVLQKKIDAVPFIDTFDLRFKNYEKQSIPSSQAVMFCLMDVSGSMDQATKDIAKRFYFLLYLFLIRNYKHVDVVFIRHHTQAKEVDEHEFFYSQETGGTIVSSALALMHQIIKERYPADKWNIYAVQASDGDNWADDSPTCKEFLVKNLLPLVRHYSYIEITRRAHQTLWQEYESLNIDHNNFSMQHIKNAEDIYPIFRELFKKQTA